MDSLQQLFINAYFGLRETQAHPPVLRCLASVAGQSTDAFIRGEGSSTF